MRSPAREKPKPSHYLPESLAVGEDGSGGDSGGGEVAADVPVAGIHARAPHRPGPVRLQPDELPAGRVHVIRLPVQRGQADGVQAFFNQVAKLPAVRFHGDGGERCGENPLSSWFLAAKVPASR